MFRKSTFFAICALAFACGAPGQAQDSPSLGDLARQVQKDKSSAPVAKVFTNDDLPSSPSFGSGSRNAGSATGLGTGLGQAAPAPSPSKQSAPAAPSDQLSKLSSMLDQIASLDRATLVKIVLQDGADSNFPGRSSWEDKLVSAKDVYVSQGRSLLQKAHQIEASMDSLKSVQDPNDPRVKNLMNRLQQLEQEGVRADATFQAVMMEGRDLAGQSAPGSSK